MRIIFNRIAEEYYHLKNNRKKELFNSYAIDCGTDYARYILNEIVYDKEGESIY